MTTDKSRADALTEAERLLLARVNDCTKPIDAADRNGILKLIDRLAASQSSQPAAAPIDTPTDREFALSAAICVHPKGVYGDEGGSMCCPITHTRDASFAPSPAAERAAFEAWRDKRAFNMPSYGGLAEAYAWDAWQARAASANETGAEGAEPMAVPDGWKLVRVNEHFDALIAALERAESKGYLPETMREEWENFACDENVTASPPPAQADAREGLTDEQRSTLESLARTSTPYEQEVLRSILAAHPGQPEPADCGETLPGEYTNADDLIASLREPEPRAEVTGDTVLVPKRVVELLRIINRDGIIKRASELQEVYRLVEAARAQGGDHE